MEKDPTKKVPLSWRELMWVDCNVHCISSEVILYSYSWQIFRTSQHDPTETQEHVSKIFTFFN